MFRKLVSCLSFFALVVLALQAQTTQDVFVLPGSTSSGQSVAAFIANPLSPLSSITTGAGASLVLTANNKFYIISNSTSVTVTDSTFSSSTLKTIGSFTQPATGAAVSPDGTLLAVAAGNLYIFNTATDTLVGSTSGVFLGTGVNAEYVAAGLDGKSFFTASATSSGTQVNAVVATTLSLSGTPLTITQATPTGITVGPNGLVYVTTQNPNQLVEVNPSTLTVTPGGLIALSGSPGVPVFTPDGLYAVLPVTSAPNGSASSSVICITLASHALAGSLAQGVPVSSLQLLSTNTVAAFSSLEGTVVQIVIGTNGTLSQGQPLALPTGLFVSAITVSDEVPGGSVLTKAGLYAAGTGATGGGLLSRLDLPTNSVTQASLPSGLNVGTLSFTTPPTSGNVATLLAYGTTQNVVVSGTSLPLVVQALDSAGNPLNGVTVTFAVTSGSGTLTSSSATTLSNGYALTYLTAPSTAGAVQVTATVGSRTATFNITAGASSVTGAAANLTIVAGQGQLLPEGTNTANAVNGGQGSSLVVLVTDSNGNPVSGAPVTFTLTSSTIPSAAGSLTGNGTSETVNTDSKGHASVDFSGAPAGTLGFIQAGYSTTSIVATSGSNSVTFYITTEPFSPTLASPYIQVPNGAAQSGTIQPGNNVTGRAGTVAGTFVVTVTSAGAGVANIGLALSNGGLDPTQFPSASCKEGNPVLTDATGTATCSVVLGPVPGSGIITPVIGALPILNAGFNITVTPSMPAAVTITAGNSQSGNPGTALSTPLTVQVTDANGNALNGVTVSWQVSPAGSVTLSNTSTLTQTVGSNSGIASVSATLGNTAGVVQVTASVTGATSAVFSITINATAAGIQKVSGDGQTGLISTAFTSPLVVQVVDSKNNPVQGATVTFAVTSGSATLGSQIVATSSNGQASTTVTAGSSAGAITITASTGSFSVSFSLTSQLPGPTNITIVNGASFQPGISPGGIATIFGSGIAPSVQGLVSANNIFGSLPLTLAGVSISFNGTPAPIFYVSNSNGQQQITVQVPFEVTPGPAVSVVITSATGATATVNTAVQPYAPAAFTTNSFGKTIAVAQRPNGSFVGLTNTALQGEITTFYVTGLGQVTPAATTGSGGDPSLGAASSLIPAQTVNVSVAAGVNNGGDPIISITYVPGLVGVYAVTFQIPTNAATGMAQPFGLIVTDSQGNQYFMPSVTIPIE